MGKAISKLGGPRKAAQLDLWRTGEQSIWSITINEAEVTAQLLRKRRTTEDKLENETSKRRKLEGKVNELSKQVKIRRKK